MQSLPGLLLDIYSDQWASYPWRYFESEEKRAKQYFKTL